eukprot:COSAG03_NODE_849_length_5637_cov_3.297941_1_plen_112_part_10
MSGGRNSALGIWLQVWCAAAPPPSATLVLDELHFIRQRVRRFGNIGGGRDLSSSSDEESSGPDSDEELGGAPPAPVRPIGRAVVKHAFGGQRTYSACLPACLSLSLSLSLSL